MRVLVDTNVVLSAILFPEGTAARAFASTIRNHHLVLSDYTIDELRDVFQRKFPKKAAVLESFIGALSYEAVASPPAVDPSEYPGLRDPDDLPILASAADHKCECLVTGDNDLLVLALPKLRIYSPAQFLKQTETDPAGL